MKTRFPVTVSFTFRYHVAVWNEQVSSLSHIFHMDAKPPCFPCLALKESLENTVARSENLFSIPRVNWLFQKDGAPEAAFLSRVHVKAFYGTISECSVRGWPPRTVGSFSWKPEQAI